MKGIFLVLLIGNILHSLNAEDCELKNNCRLVDTNGDDEWANEPGHYRAIQPCIDDAENGDTCLIRPGNYHEEMIITGKNNIAIRGDLDYGRPVIDGTVVLQLKTSTHHDPKSSEKNAPPD